MNSPEAMSNASPGQRVSSRGHRNDLQRLRAVAVVMVVLYHFGGVIPGGLLGVDLFFVLSGYLIIGGCHRGLMEDRFDWRAFYRRRFRRLAPQAVACGFATSAVALWLYTPSDLSGVGHSVLSSLGGAANVYQWQSGGYFAADAAARPLLHHWSLAVEEQFYLVMPLALMGVAAWRPRWMFALLATATLASWAGFACGDASAGGATFYLMPFRFWQLAAGGLLAVAEDRYGDRILRRLHLEAFDRVRSGRSAHKGRVWTTSTLKRLAMVAAVLGFAALSFHPTAAHSHATLAATSATIGGLILILAGRDSVDPPAWLDRPLIWLGDHSYGIYLWHWPVWCVIEYVRPPDLVFTPAELGWAIAVATVVTCTTAVLSERWTERPVRAQSARWGTGTDWLVVGSMGVLAVFAGLISLPHIDPYRTTVTRSEGYPLDAEILRSDRVASTPWHRIGARDRPPTFALIGDSHALAACEAIDRVASSAGRAGVAIARRGTCPLPGVRRSRDVRKGYGLDWSDQVWMSLRQKYPTVGRVILVARWNAYLNGEPDGGTSAMLVPPAAKAIEGGRRLVSDPETRSAIASETFRDGLRRIDRLAERWGLRIVVVEQAPCLIADPGRRRIVRDRLGRDWNPPPVAYHRRRNRSASEAIAQMPIGRWTFQPTLDLFVNDRGKIDLDGVQPMYRDADHLSEAGAARIARRFRETSFRPENPESLVARRVDGETGGDRPTR